MKEQTATYPQGPVVVPEDLTRPHSAYRLRAWLAVLALGAFLAAYAALAAWFAATAYELFASAVHGRGWYIVAGVSSALLALFMIKAVFFVRRGKVDGLVPIALDDHPRLREFIHRLADEARAPRPRRVYLSHDVNAAVFYDLSLLNLFLPASKNLLIGLGLVNVLNLSELKAVIAHELGHFAQRSMKVGRWVYVAQQIAQHLVERRDAFDDLLRGVSHFDIRVAWIGWLLRLVVWSIRAVIETLFGWVALVERALSREMEYQADRVSVSLTGSDALVHALARASVADEELANAASFALRMRAEGEPVADLFAIQARLLEEKRRVLADPERGAPPELPTDPQARAAHRVFRQHLAQPPRMWSSHPSNEAREDNAKRTYVAAPIDTRPAWVLFDAPDALRAEVTAHFYDLADAEEAGGQRDPAATVGARRPEPVPIARSLERLAAEFARESLDPKYQGLYLGRSVARHARTPDDMAVTPSGADLRATLAGLYPAHLSEVIERADERAEELGLLEALERGVLEAPGGVVHFRGRDHRRRELPQLIATVRAEHEEAQRALREHDTTIRGAHLEAAARVSPGWVEYLKGLHAVLHYADHNAADVADDGSAFENVIAIVLADRKVSESELARLLNAARSLHTTLETLYTQAGGVELAPALAEQLGGESWSGVLGAFELPAPSRSNIGEWIGPAFEWVSAASAFLRALGRAALEELLRVEAALGRHVSGEAAMPEVAPAPPSVLVTYPILMAGERRPRQTRLDLWDRFMVADGIGPTIARLAVAVGIVLGVLLGGRSLLGR